MFNVYFQSVSNQCFIGNKQDDLVVMLEQEDDFKASRSILEEEINKMGGTVLHGVKFHPEFMLAESVYRFVNVYIPEHLHVYVNRVINFTQTKMFKFRCD